MGILTVGRLRLKHQTTHVPSLPVMHKIILFITKLDIFSLVSILDQRKL